jgi:hypothetical protein
MDVAFFPLQLYIYSLNDVVVMRDLWDEYNLMLYVILS